MRSYDFSDPCIHVFDEAFDAEGGLWFEGEEMVLDPVNCRPMADLMDDGLGGLFPSLRGM